MKKFLALVLALCAIALAFTGCDMLSSLKPAEETTADPNAPKTFSYGALNITLPAGFVEQSSGKYSNEDYSIRCTKMLFSSITPTEGNDFPTLEVFMKNFPSFKEDPEKIVLKEENGITYVDYVTTSTNIASLFTVQKDGDTQCFMGFETESAFYIISFYSPTLDYETAKAQAFEWAKTITFSEQN